ncbi:phosphoserine phosphatase SerB [Campylobacter pinnipediorum subsp. pinnipediorum]|uniref:Phosphoserine phosphatase n=1 Tax=Campylobacter pinnipediorum subsp. pinnipediorum TaxID=1660067 RepID=A0AAX0L9C0_9BACT|nr:phosphoserine phosphatase SerB [Campylobacter pinnipediorum]AQW85064.1 phosphoserine phosphatase [Campylobacter pinnipediorum subsp. pinnipediorum]OPA76451.1 phosphoserine phosphatase SerB [Campylobacter pinnipediorum subsp. pinnipediorum]OPA79912.1 phosphoserine phosphatase SerB [Campylobacter pinnipediorum subsp. pinnipediorum]
MIKLCIFDFDSTLMDGETIDILARSYGVGDEVKNITKKAMAGELDFFESLTSRVSLLEGMSYFLAKDICENLPVMNGAKELIDNLKAKGIKVVVFSGGFDLGTNAMQKKLNFDASFANILHQKDGKLTGRVGGEMMFGFSKGKMLQKIQKIINVDISNTMCVGDGANDISMFEYSNLKIAFCANEILKQNATHCVDQKDLREILKLI